MSGPNGSKRSRPVIALTPAGLTVGLTEADRDLVNGSRIRIVELWHDGARVMGAEAQVSELVTHRARPLHAQLLWQGARADDLTRVGRLLRRIVR